MYRLTRYSYPASSFRTRAPWTGLESDLDRLFETALADFATPASPRFPVDLYEDKDNTYVRAELPGVTREQVNLELVDGYLTLTAARKEGEQEFTLTRSVSLPDNVQSDKITAALEHGILTVTLPKQEQAKPRKIAINVN